MVRQSVVQKRTISLNGIALFQSPLRISTKLKNADALTGAQFNLKK